MSTITRIFRQLRGQRENQFCSKTTLLMANVFMIGLSFFLLFFGAFKTIEEYLGTTTSLEAPGFDTTKQHQHQHQQQQQQRYLQLDELGSIDFDFGVNVNSRSIPREPLSSQDQTPPPVDPSDGRVIPRDKLAEYNYNRDDEASPETDDSVVSSSGISSLKPSQTPAIQENTVIEEIDDDYDVVVIDDEASWDYAEDKPEEISITDSKNVDGPTTTPTANGYIFSDVDDDDFQAVVILDDVPWDDIAVKESAEDAFEAIEALELEGSLNANTNSSNDESEYEFYPTRGPTISPRPSRSFRPTSSVSVKPTNRPSIEPSLKHSSHPSAYPSFLPTNEPSRSPSAFPTNSCHDDTAYRSPINGLSCEDHYGTPCLNWRHIGLNMTELDELVWSCPETCNVECGSFHLFSAPISFRISRVSGFMDPEDVDAFFKFSIIYLEDYVRSVGWNSNGDEPSGSNDNVAETVTEDGGGREDDFLTADDGVVVVFEIEDAVLEFQNLVEDPSSRLENLGENEISKNSKPTSAQNGNSSFRRDRVLRSRGLQDLQRTKQKAGGESIVKTDEALDVSVTFDGFTIGMNPKSMSELLVLGIDDVDFTRKLQKSGIIFFSDATVSSAMETIEDDIPSEQDFSENENKGNSTFTVVISYMVPIVVIGFALGSVFYHRCYKKGRWTALYQNRHEQQQTERTQFGGMSATPIAAGIQNSDNSNSIVADSSEGDGRFSNSNRQSSNADFSNDAKGGDKRSAFAKLISTLNLNITLTKSKNSGDEEEVPKIDGGTSDSSSSSDEQVPKQRKKIPVIGSPLVSPMSEETTSNESSATSIDKEGFKVYASVLPPMIVIDNIDISETDTPTPVKISTDASGGELIDSSFRSSASSQIDELDAFASEYRRQLLEKSGKPIDSKHHSFTGSFYDAYSRSSLDLRSDQGMSFGPSLHAEDEFDARQIVDTMSDDWDDPDDLFPPIPSNITADGGRNNEVDLDDELDQRHANSRSMQTISPLTVLKERTYGTWGGNSSSADISNVDTDLSASSLPAALPRGTKSDVSMRRRGSLPPKRPPTPERGNITRNNPSGGTNDKSPVSKEQHNKRLSFSKSASAFSFTPIARALMGGGSSFESDGHKRRSSADKAEDLVKNHSSISTVSSEELTNTNSKNNNPNRLEYEAPRQGNWGIVLESSSKTGPRIYAVKEYSPLFGLIKKGDKLLEIDGKNVTQSNLAEMTKILKGKSSSKHRSASTSVPIVVFRESPSTEAPVIGSFAYNTSFSSNDRHHLQEQYSSHDHQRNGSYGSYGSAASRVLEDIDEHHDDNINDMDQNQLPQQIYHSPYDSNNEI